MPAHKVLLATASDVFRAMFNGSYIEKTEVKIADASVGAFEEFLQFIYRPMAKVTMANVAEVMYLGKKYGIVECFDICADFLIEHFDDGDVLRIYESVALLEHKFFLANCKEYIMVNAKEIFETESFLNCDRKTLKWILQMDTLLCSEGKVFEALMKWIKAESGQEELTQEIVQDEFGDLLHEIRFGSMDWNMFSDIGKSYGALLTSADYSEIIQMMNSIQYQPKIFKKNCRFDFEWDENAIVECYRLKSETLHAFYIREIETTTITVNKPVLLGSFSYADFYEPEDYTLKKDISGEITIIQTPDLTKPSGENVVLYNRFVNLTKDNCIHGHGHANNSRG